jgi:hypothetical protein
MSATSAALFSWIRNSVLGWDGLFDRRKRLGRATSDAKADPLGAKTFEAFRAEYGVEQE